MTHEINSKTLAAQWGERLTQLLSEALAQSLATPFCDALIECGRDGQVAIELARNTPSHHRAAALVDCAEALWRASDKRAVKVALEGLRTCTEWGAYDCLRVVQSFSAVEQIQQAAHKKASSWSASRRNLDALSWAEATKLRLCSEGFLSEDRGAVRARAREVVAVVSAKSRYDTGVAAFAALCAELARIDALDGDTEGALAHFEQARAELESAKSGVEIALPVERREREVAYACALRSLLDAAHTLADRSAIDACASVFLPIHCGNLSAIPAILASLKLPEPSTFIGSSSHLWLDAMRESSDPSVLEPLRARVGTPHTAEQIEDHYENGLITTSERLEARTGTARAYAREGRADDARAIVDTLERQARGQLQAVIDPLREIVRATLDRGAVTLPPLVAAARATPLDASVLAEHRASWASLARVEGDLFARSGAAKKCAVAILRHAAAVALRGDRTAATALVDEVTAPLVAPDDDRARMTRASKFAVELLTAQVATGMLNEAILTSREHAYVRDGQAPLPHLVDELLRAGGEREAHACVSAAIAQGTDTRPLEHSLRAILRLASDAASLTETASVANRALDSCEAWARSARS
ncbi:MAG: hypothetical protein JNK05_05010 [Myxococcales bacterium]|nr:hypothetical protein [Myxococcales bacterium]